MVAPMVRTGISIGGVGATRRRARGGRRVALGLLLLAAVAGAWLWHSITPSNHRQWIPEQAIMPHARFEGSLVHLQGVRNFRWEGRDRFSPAWEERTFDLDRLQTVWFILAPFGKEWRGPAHAMLSFGFADSSFLAVSVEARKEPGEGYSIWKGLLKRYELLYVVADERDVLPLRAVIRGDDVFVYPLRASPEKVRQLLVSMLLRANELARHPRFYNTLTGNCTTTLLRHANDVAERPLRGGWRVLLPGYSDQVLRDAQLLPADLTLEQARQKYRANERIRRCLGDSQFSACLRRTETP